MRVSSNEKAELVAYQLKDVPQTCYTQLKDNRALRANTISWEIFRSAFLNRFFPRKKEKQRWKNLSTFIKKEWVFNNNLWNSLSFLNMPLLWWLIRAMKWFSLWWVCPIIFLKCFVRQCFKITWSYHVWWFMLNKLRIVGLRRKIWMPRGKGPMIEVLLRVNMKSKTNQSLRRDSPTKFLITSQYPTRIGCITLSLKEERVKFHNLRNPIVPNVAKGIWVNV